jgi:predicted ester cyclase
MPPSGRSFTVSNADFCRFTDDGMICEHWGLIDIAAIMRKLGAEG